MRDILVLLVCLGALSGCGGDGLTPPGQTSALAPAGADPGTSGVSGEAGAASHGAPLGATSATGPVAGPTPNPGP